MRGRYSWKPINKSRKHQTPLLRVIVQSSFKMFHPGLSPCQNATLPHGTWFMPNMGARQRSGEGVVWRNGLSKRVFWESPFLLCPLKVFRTFQVFLRANLKGTEKKRTLQRHPFGQPFLRTTRKISGTSAKSRARHNPEPRSEV